MLCDMQAQPGMHELPQSTRLLSMHGACMQQRKGPSLQ